MIRSVTAYKKGAVCLLVSGEYPERFINFCLTAGIYLWGVKKRKKQLTLWIYLSDFKKIRGVVQKSKVKIKIIERYGLPFLLKKLQRRKTLLAGAIVFFVAIYWLSGYVWFMEIQGLKKIPMTEVAAILAEEGLGTGARRDDIEEKTIEKKMMANVPTIAWVGIRFTGVKAIVEIVEKEGVFDEKRNLGDLVASKAGVITECIVLSGEKMINVGDRVNEGDVLIKSVNRSEKEFIKAEGIVKAKISYDNYGEAALKKYLYERTGRTDFSLKFFVNDYCINLKEAKTEGFCAYEIEHMIKKTDGWRNSDFAVELIVDVYHELHVDLVEFNREEARQAATLNAIAAGGNVIPEDAYVISRETSLQGSEDANLIKVMMKVETEEEIGKHIKYNRE